MDKIDQLILDTQLYIDEARQKVIEWKLKLDEREKFLASIQAVKGNK